MLAVNDVPEGYDYPPEVRFKIQEQRLRDYREAADFLRFNGFDVLCLQHEFGIYGGRAGSHILALLDEVRLPVVTTLHTVLTEPSADQRRVMDELVRHSQRLVVMTERGRSILRGDLPRPAGEDRPDRPRDPGHAVRRSEPAQGAVRGRGKAGAADLRAAVPEQGHRICDPGVAGDHPSSIRS